MNLLTREELLLLRRDAWLAELPGLRVSELASPHPSDPARVRVRFLECGRVASEHVGVTELDCLAQWAQAREATVEELRGFEPEAPSRRYLDDWSLA